MPKIDYFVGIDPGSSGAISIIERKDNYLSVNSIFKMPMTVDPQGNDLVNIKWIVSELKRFDSILVVGIEKIHFMPSDKNRPYAVIKLIEAYRDVYAALRVCDFNVKTISCKAWQNMMLGQLDKGVGTVAERRKELKTRSIKVCEYIYPELSLIGKGCRVPSDALSDATLIAHYTAKFYEQI